MKFGSVHVAEAAGATAVHSIRQGDFVLKKGTLIGPAEVAALKTAGVKEITVARLDPGGLPAQLHPAPCQRRVPDARPRDRRHCPHHRPQ